MSVWKVIPGFSRYSASEQGEVRRDVDMRGQPAGPVAQRVDSHGYWSCCLTGDDGKHRKVQTHRLIAAAFLGTPPEGLIVCHGPSGSKVNSVNNLRYDTQAANIADQQREGTRPKGTAIHCSKLTEDDVRQILVLITLRQLKHKEIGALFGVDGANVGRIATGKIWCHVPRPANMPPPRFSVSRTREAKAAKRDRAFA